MNQTPSTFRIRDANLPMLRMTHEAPPAPTLRQRIRAAARAFAKPIARCC